MPPTRTTLACLACFLLCAKAWHQLLTNQRCKHQLERTRVVRTSLKQLHKQWGQSILEINTCTHMGIHTNSKTHTYKADGADKSIMVKLLQQQGAHKQFNKQKYNQGGQSTSVGQHLPTQKRGKPASPAPTHTKADTSTTITPLPKMF